MILEIPNSVTRAECSFDDAPCTDDERTIMVYVASGQSILIRSWGKPSEAVTVGRETIKSVAEVLTAIANEFEATKPVDVVRDEKQLLLEIPL